MADLIYLLDQSFRTEIRNEVYNGIRDIYKVREHSEEMLKRMVLLFKSELKWNRTDLPIEGVEDEKVIAIIDHLITYGDHCKDDMIGDLIEKLSEKVSEAIEEYIDDNVTCSTLRDMVYDQIDASSDAYGWVEECVDVEKDKLKVIDKHLEAEDADIHSGHIDTM